jgi:hypothetical protein
VTPSGIPTARFWVRSHQAALAIAELEACGYRVEVGTAEPALYDRGVRVVVRPPFYRRVLFLERTGRGQGASLVLALRVALERVSRAA